MVVVSASRLAAEALPLLGDPSTACLHGSDLAEAPRTHCTSAAGVGHSTSWTWGTRLFPTFKNRFERDKGGNPSFLTFFFSQTLHLTSLPAGTL